MDKYYAYLLNKTDNVVKKITNSNNKSDVLKLAKEYMKLKNISNDIYDCVLIKYEKINYNEDQPIKMVYGPIKVSVLFYNITKRQSIKENKNDNRNNYLFITKKFLEKNNKNIIMKYLKKIVEYANKNKLEKRLLAPKTIDQIKKN